MKVSLNLAQWYSNVDLKSLPTEELVKLATERLGGVEGYDDLSKHYEGIVVARVVSCVKHPNADKLSLCKVDDGGKIPDVDSDSDGYVQVVCGAPNVREGILVAWIPPRAVVPSSYGEKELFVLEARDLRGEISNGMIASPRELGLNDDHEGILEIDENEMITTRFRHPEPIRSELRVERHVEGSDQISPQGRDDEEVVPGTSFASFYNLDDVIIDIENKMFTHRPDCFGQLGVARELAGIQGLKFESPDWYKKSASFIAGSSDVIKGVGVTIESPELCPRYMAISFDEVKIQPSPIWLQSYLKRLGVRPINNVVDITNYIMLLTAQPLHAFDFDKIAKDGRADIVVRKPRSGEKMTLLDGKEIQPHVDATLICNQDGPIALGGVMGGGNSEIDENTKRIVLECATFDMYNIRKTSMTHGLFTDAVTRFNKGQPAEQLPPVMYKAIEMIQEVVGAKPIGEVVDSYPGKTEQKDVKVSVDFINNRLGSNLSSQQIVSLLTNVEFDVQTSRAVIPDLIRDSEVEDMDSRLRGNDDNELIIKPPFWRTDIEIAEDIVEEVGRLYGFNNLPIELPIRSIKPVSPTPQLALKSKIRKILSRAGANEVLNYSFVHGNLLKKVGQKPEDSYALRNALSPDLQFYRQTLTPSILDLVHKNVKSGFDEFALFEINKSHNKSHDSSNEELPGELNMISLVYTDKKSPKSAYYSARRYLDFLANSLGYTLIYTPIEKDPGYPVTAPFDFKRSALVTVKEADVFLGIVGEYKQMVVDSLKLPKATAGFEIGLDHLLEAQKKGSEFKYKPLSKYPSSEQDLTLKVPINSTFGELESVLWEALESSGYEYKLQPLSVFSKSDSDDKNVSFRIELTSQTHTLTTDEVSGIIDELAETANNKLNAQRI